MKKSHKIWLMIITLLPIILIPVFILFAFFGAIGMDSMENFDTGVPNFVARLTR